MLVLSRKRDEQIVIGEGANQVILVVVDIRSDKVRLGIEAAKDVPVHRREVYDAIRRNDLAAHVKAVAIDAIKAVGKEAV